MGKAIVNCNAQYMLTNPAQSAVLTAVSSPYSNVKAGGAPVYAGQLTIQITGFVGTVVVTQGAPVCGNIQTTATKVKAGGNLVFLEGDAFAAPVIVSGQDAKGCAAAEPATVCVCCAGQSKVLGV